MSLIADRPRDWGQLVGQATAIQIVTAFLRHPQFMTRGLTFSGPAGVGKTTCAYLVARALMCTGNVPTGCGECNSCLCADASLARAHDLSEHPDFKELDAASLNGTDQSKSGVERARELILHAETLPVLGARRVVLVDEAHRNSQASWDVYLKTLEAGDFNTVYIFSTSEPTAIPGTIRSRCAPVEFTLVLPDAMMGRLVSLATKHQVPYELDGIRRIAALSGGRVRDAVRLLGTVAASAMESRLTVALVDSLVNHDAERTVRDVLTLVASGQVPEAVTTGDPLVFVLGAARVTSLLFAAFAEEVFRPSAAALANSFVSIPAVTQCFLKWTTADYLPNETFPLLLMELSELRKGKMTSPLEPYTGLSVPDSLAYVPHISQPLAPADEEPLEEGAISPEAMEALFALKV